VTTNASSNAGEAAALAAETAPAPAATTRVSTNVVLVVVAVAQFMIVLDATIVNVALPTIQRDVGFSEQSLVWILNAYTLIFGGFLLLGGRLADRLGRRRLFMTGVALFSAASLVCGLSQSEATLLVARGVQGLGGALVSPAALSIILTNFAEGPERNRALAVWGAIAGAGGAVGLLLGGLIVEALSWRWVFFVNVPVGALLLAAAPRRIPESRSEGAAGGYDVEGAVAITLGTIALVFTLIKANDWGWGSGRTVGGFIAAALLFTAFVLIERTQKNPLVPLRMFSARSLTAAAVTSLLLSASLFGVIFFITLYLQQVLGFSALKTGVAYMPMSLSIIGSSTIASRLVDRYSPKPVLVGGLVVATAGLLLLTRASGHSDYAEHVLPAMVVMGIGLGMSFVPVTIAATNGVPPQDSGLASGLLNTALQVGGALGLAILTSVSTPRTNDALDAGSSLRAALTHGFKGGFVAAACMCLLGLIVALAFLPGRARTTEATEAELSALASSCCPAAPQGGYLARAAAAARRLTRVGRAHPSSSTGSA
jgi:EmrB/QacA subfamily drug resistance transporter